MTTQALNWTLNLERGTVYFGKPLPFAGNTYRIILDGGKVDGLYVIYLMSDDGVECLAKSKYDGVNYHIAFNTAALRDAFVREPHEARTFHCYVRNAEYLGPDDLKEGSTVAEGDLTIVWNPLWTEAATGKAYTMKGEPGKPGSPGGKGEKGDDGASAYELAKKAGFSGSEDEWLASLRGAPAAFHLVPAKTPQGDDDGWRVLYVQPDEYGKLRLVVGSERVDSAAEGALYVTVDGDTKVTGTKTFLNPIKGTTTGNLPLSGGTMTGGIRMDMEEFPISAVDDKRTVRISGGTGWDTGASFVARGKDHPRFPGEFICKAKDGEDECILLGKPDGSFTWGGKNIVRSVNGAEADRNGNVTHFHDLRYLQLTGGTITGTIKAGLEGVIEGNTDARAVRISGGQGWYNGASLVVYGQNYPDIQGHFRLKASAGDVSSVLVGKPDGTLTWNGKEVLRSNLSSSWRIIELGGGYVMMWAHIVGNGTYTLPLPMADASYTVFSAIDQISGGYNERHNITRTTTSFKVDSSNGVNGYIIIGKKA